MQFKIPFEPSRSLPQIDAVAFVGREGVGIRGIDQKYSSLIGSVDEGGCAGDVNTHGEQEQGGNNADEKFHTLPPLIIDLVITALPPAVLTPPTKTGHPEALSEQPTMGRKSD